MRLTLKLWKYSWASRYFRVRGLGGITRIAQLRVQIVECSRFRLKSGFDQEARRSVRHESDGLLGFFFWGLNLKVCDT